MPYQHYGGIGDVWKHLPLGEIIKAVNPKLYIESNSAFSSYKLEPSLQRGYGIGFFLASAPKNPWLAQSHYYQIEASHYQNQMYLGSSGLAFTLLGGNSKYLFCDLEAEALQQVQAYGASLGLEGQVTLYHGDSIEYCLTNIANWPAETLLFLDPYQLLEKSAVGQTYFDVFLEALRRKVPAVLWYGFDTRREQQVLHEVFMQRLASGSGVALAEINLANIGTDSPALNPGVGGCGLLMANLDSSIVAKVNQLCIQLKNIYLQSIFEKQSGKLQITMDYF